MRQCVHFCTLLVTVSLCMIHMHPLEATDHGDTEYLNSFIVKVSDETDIERVAEEHGFTIKEKLPDLNIYHLTHAKVAKRSKRADNDFVSRVKEDPRVTLVEQQRILKRFKRSFDIVHDKQLDFQIPDIQDNSKYFRLNYLDARDQKAPRFNDPYYRDQWYLKNDGLNDENAMKDIDMNVVPAWDMGFTGRGVVVSILDDGVDHDHPDIRRNYDPEASDDLNDEDDLENDPEPDKRDDGNSHGTRCAGEVAGEANNGICGVGVSYDARIGGIRILDGPVTDVLEAKAILFKKNYIDIKSASWGPHDQGKTMAAPSTACKEALTEAAKTGRNGKGTIFVWAAGNGGGYDDNCGADGYVSSIESICVQSMSPKGELPFFGEKCTATMISVPSGGETDQKAELAAIYKVKVVTTDVNGGCIENFEGTSSAAPLAAGCMALVLQANPELTWRDVQHIVARGARIPGPDQMWINNGADFHVNPQYGFGMIDCARMVQLAQGWVNKPPQHQCETDINTVSVEIPNSGCHKLRFDFGGCQDDEATTVTHMEHVEIKMKIKPVRRGNMQIIITSPSGTRSEVLRPRSKDDTNEEIDFTFMTVHNWEEDPVGEWTLEVCDQPPRKSQGPKHDSAGLFESWQLKVSGYQDHDYGRKRGKAKPIDDAQIQIIVKKELEESRSIVLKRAQVNNFEDADEVDNEEDVDDFVNNVDRLFQTFSETFGVRSLEEYLEDYLQHKNGYQALMSEKRGNNYAEDKRGFEVGKEIDDNEKLKHEMIDVLRELDSRKTETGESFLDTYISKKREMLRKERIRELIDKVNDLLGEK